MSTFACNIVFAAIFMFGIIGGIIQIQAQTSVSLFHAARCSILTGIKFNRRT